MAPIPPKTRKQPRRNNVTTVTTDDVIDRSGRTLTTIHRKQKRLDREQDENTLIARQHAAQGDNSEDGQKIIFRDIFALHKYTLYMNHVSWIDGGNGMQIGWTRGSEYHDVVTPIDSSSAFDDHKIEFGIDGHDASYYEGIETLELRLWGAPEGITAYLVDSTDTSTLMDAINDLIDSITGDGGYEERIEELETHVDDLEERVTALENQ